MSSSMLEQAIIDAKELKESAQRNAEETIVEKYQSEIKEAVEKILEQEDPLGLGGDLGGGLDAGLGAGGGGTPESANQPEAGKDQIDMVLEQLPFIQTTGDDQVIELDLGKLEESLNIVSEDEEDGLRDDIKALEEIELDEDLLDEYMLDEEFELDEEMLEEEDLDEIEVPDDTYNRLVDKATEKEGAITEDLSLEEMIAEALEEMLGDGKTQGPDSVEAGLDNNEGFTQMDLAAEQGGKRGPGKKETEKKDKESKKLQRENKTLIKEQTRMSSKVQLLENKLDKYGTVIDQLKQKLDESNLASAKLLYQNRVLDSVSLNERQKDRIVEAIKDAETVEEAKIIFETLQSTVETAGKSSRKRESLDEVVYRGSSAFMPLKEDKQKVSDPFVARMKTLAGLK